MSSRYVFQNPGSPEAIHQIKVALLLSFILLVAAAFYIIYVKTSINSAPEQTALVKVVKKSIIHTNAGRASGTNRIITFEFPDGSRKGFQLNKPAVFDTYNDGDTGVLVYKESKGWIATDRLIISFEKN